MAVIRRLLNIKTLSGAVAAHADMVDARASKAAHNNLCIFEPFELDPTLPRNVIKGGSHLEDHAQFGLLLLLPTHGIPQQ